jgi:hypothetical protein
MINDRPYSTKHKLLEQHNGEFGIIGQATKLFYFFLTNNNFVYTIPYKLFQMMNVRRIIQLAGSERGGGTEDFRILLFLE